MKEYNLYELLFWIIIVNIYSIMFIIVLLPEKNELLIIAAVPITSFVVFLIGAKIKKSIKFHPTGIIGYFVENFIFFILFIVSLFLLGKELLYIKVIQFFTLTAIGTFNTYFLIKEFKKK